MKIILDILDLKVKEYFRNLFCNANIYGIPPWDMENFSDDRVRAKLAKAEGFSAWLGSCPLSAQLRITYPPHLVYVVFERPLIIIVHAKNWKTWMTFLIKVKKLLLLSA